MSSYRKTRRILRLSVIIILSTGLTGCLGMYSNNYSGDGDLKVTQTGLNERALSVTLNQFDARNSYQNHREIIRFPESNRPHYFHLRITNQRLYTALYHSSAYSWESFGGEDLLKSTVLLKIKPPNGDVMVKKRRPLSQFSLTSPEAGVIDFLLFSYNPDQDHQIHKYLTRDVPLRIVFEFEAQWEVRPDDRINANLVFETGSR